MNTQFERVMNDDRTRKALPKCKTLSNRSLQMKGGAASYGAASYGAASYGAASYGAASYGADRPNSIAPTPSPN